MSGHVQLIKLIKRQLQEVVLILPRNLGFCEAFALSGTGWRVCDFGDKVRGGSLGYAIHEDSDDGDFQNKCERKRETKENPFAILEPAALLFRGESNTGEVWLELSWS